MENETAIAQPEVTQRRFLVVEYGDTYHDCAGPQFTEVEYWKDFWDGEGNYIGFVEDESSISIGSQSYFLQPEMFFAVSGRIYLNGGSGIVFKTARYKPQMLFGGPVEEWGRLKYIDGCTDSLLIPPVKFGDPCLNALFFPPNINQTQHVHPSLRAGLVIRGKGMCHTPERDTPLIPGTCFIIETDCLHYFSTPPDDSMTVIAYHPDSDIGPKDDDHPMINRTVVEGVSASKIDRIRTK